MNSFSEQMSHAFSKHESSLTEMKKLLQSFNMDTLLQENVALKEQSQNLEQELQAMADKQVHLQKSLNEVKQQYYNHLVKEKMTFASNSKKRMDELFKNQVNAQMNQLAMTEKAIHDRFNRFNQKVREQDQALADRYNTQLLDLFEDFKASVAAHQEAVRQEVNATREAMESAYEAPELNRVTPEQMQKTDKKNPLELKLGLNVVNKLGIILVLFAILLAGRHTFSVWFNDYMKGIAFFLIGTLFLVAGEWMHRKALPVVSKGLIGGGLGILYTSTFVSHFYLGILSMEMAMVVSVLITAVAVLLTLHYKSAVVCAMSLVGGFLPVFAYAIVFGLDQLPGLTMLVYLTLLNGLVLAISMKHKWYSVVYVSFFMNIPCSNFLITQLSQPWWGVAYTFIVFFIYTGVVSFRNIFSKEPLKVPDVIILVINTLVNVSMVYYLFDKLNLDDRYGFIAIVYAVLYFAAARYMEAKAADAKMTHTFYAFTVGFSVLVVPLQLADNWIFAGWLAESLVFTYYGRKQGNLTLEKLGNLLFGLTHVVFLADVGHRLGNLRAYLSAADLKYLALIASEIAVMALYKTPKEGAKAKFASIYCYFVFSSTVVFLYYQVQMVYDKWIHWGRNPAFYGLVFGGLTFIGIYELLKRLDLNAWINGSVYGRILNGLGCIQLILISFMGLPYARGFGWVASLMVLIASQVYVLIQLNQGFRALEANGIMTREARGILLGIYGLFIYFVNVMFKYTAYQWSLIINLSLIFFAVAYIAIGFRERFTMLRRGGLALALMATFKMILIDYESTDTIQKIISYFVFGIVLIGISYFYQQLSNKLLNKEESS